MREGPLPRSDLQGPVPDAEGRARWAAALLLAGGSAGLFSIVVYQIFNFFGISWLLFANLLFMGFPLGGYLYLRRLDGHPDAFGRSLSLLLACMVGSTGLFFVLKYPTQWWSSSLWSADAVVGLLKLSVCTALPFLAFFVAYGVVEVAGYRTWQKRFGAGANVVYALYLFGLGLGYAFFSVAIESFGPLRMALLAMVVWGAARALVAGPQRWLAPLAVVLPLGAILLPGLDGFFFRRIHPDELIWRGGRIEIGTEYRPIHERWDRSGHLTLLDSGERLLGAYVPVIAWGFERGRPAYAEGDLRRAAFRFLPPDADLLIIGTGGGRDVAHALEIEPRSIVAVEIRESLIEALRGEFGDRVDGVYDHPSVTPVVMNGRRYIEETDRTFHLIYLPAVDSLMINTRTLFDASEYMHTVESFRAMKRRLAPGGVVAVARNRGFDPRLRQFARVFHHMEEVGLTPLGLMSSSAYVLLGFDVSGPESLLGREAYRDIPVQRIVTRLDERPPLVHDDRPYEAGIPGAIVPPRHIGALFALQLVLFAGIAVAFWRFLSRRSALERWPVERRTLVMLGGILVGANFLVLEYHLVFVLLRSLEQPFDAVFLATILFLFVSGLGSVGHGRLPRRIELGVSLGGLLAALLLQGRGADTAQLLALLPAVFVTGRFFPTLFGATEGRMLRVFAMDSVGAFLATILATFVPILAGFTAYLALATALFALTFLVVGRAEAGGSAA